MFLWKKRISTTNLSAYHDGQLPPDQAGHIGEELVFNANYRNHLATYDQLSNLLNTTLDPKHIPNTHTFAQQLMDRLQLEATKTAPTSDPNTIHQQSTARSVLRPAMWASLGLIATAGITLFSLRRRKIL